ncbi:hypothetical protein L484_017032 [Morus notabilis]|uniref:ACT domain-containing protein ACR n=1 Tax=Morus notabilis TaxID=981085 RepID=W9RWT1_9ROSA|nr:hypothetical protein L484_017032 [Morus notabilis]
MGILHEDMVLINEEEKAGDPTVITVNCPDKTGLGCDLCRIILLFGLNICRGDVSTDGKWCYIVFWVVGKASTRWKLLKKRLLEVCPSYFSTSEIDYYRKKNQPPRPPEVFLLKFWCSYDREGLLHDVTEVLCELELTIKRVKVSTTPDGRVMDLFFVTDTRIILTSTKCHYTSFLGKEHLSYITVGGFQTTHKVAFQITSSILVVHEIHRVTMFALGLQFFVRTQRKMNKVTLNFWGQLPLSFRELLALSFGIKTQSINLFNINLFKINVHTLRLNGLMLN